ncbi:hypothetical protein Nepgr_025570 [Nepenthes gracilis]|uniref:Choline monooxygenase, chloroplastic n=1 Tax=Nepenthes gracilis TaxID=150966 RepID=A0AAD3XZM4_NEPGR|nr:hypothetical protein Nepgr_025570 [Nepenthes gracilis]
MAGACPMLKLTSFHGVETLDSEIYLKRGFFSIQTSFRKPRPLNRTIKVYSLCSPTSSVESARSLVYEFNPGIPIEDSMTPPRSWYTDPDFYSLELDQVFYRGWQAVGYADQIRDAHNYFTGRLGNAEFVVCRDGDGKFRAFHNVCRHHASILAYGSGQKSCFVCPYHGWTYGLDGALLKATKITEPQKIDISEYGLVPVNVGKWGPFVVINLDKERLPQLEADDAIVERDWLGSCSEMLSTSGVDSSLSYVCRREYTIQCNWKVFCDNYLDGGYHVPFAHRSLASGIDLDTYSTEIFEKASIQRCNCSSTETRGDFDRLGSEALYAFIYPNFMINRYGPWMDTNLVLPLGPRKCRVVFDYFLDASLKGDKSFIERSLQDSEQVQMEDIKLCEGVQRGLESPAYNSGRYVYPVENAMHHFHCLLHKSLVE